MRISFLSLILPVAAIIIFKGCNAGEEAKGHVLESTRQLVTSVLLIG